MLSLRALWEGLLHAFFVSSITNNHWLQSHHDNPISVTACHSFCLSYAMLLCVFVLLTLFSKVATFKDAVNPSTSLLRTQFSLEN